MNERLYSASWYRVAELKPRVRSHGRIHRHHYRGQRWYVLENQSSERFHRFSPDAYALLGLMDGQRTVQEIWDQASEMLGDAAPTQDQTIQLLGQLHSADMLQCNVPPDIAEFLRRHEKQKRNKLLQQLRSPFFWRIRLFDPEPILRRLMPLVRPAFSKVAFLAWLVVVGAAVILTGMHWRELTEDVAERVLAPQNLLLLWLLFPLFKGLHEFGHAFAVKAYGGEVHEMGIMLLVFAPLPYVDASAASAFRKKRQRIAVGAAGMMVETFLAALALIVWLNIEPGTTRTLLYNVLFITGVSTLLFNANPLLRFDGYYILADAIEIPNLYSRSSQYVVHLIERYLLGNRKADSVPATRSERVWFVTYAAASFVYRIFVISAIILFVAGKFFFVGVALALWGLLSWAVLPFFKGARYVLTSPRLSDVRRRAVAVSSGLVAAAVGLVCLLPVPLRTSAEGVIAVPEEAIVRPGTEGFIVRVVADLGTRVERGDSLFVCEDPMLVARVQATEAQITELRARRDEVWLEKRVEAQIYDEEIAYHEESLARDKEKLEKLTLRSQTDGIFVVSHADDLPGRFVRQGDPLAQILNPEVLTARVVVSQESVDLVRYRTRDVKLRLAERPGKPVQATIRREVPAASDRLPSSALGTQGGGRIAVDPGDGQGITSFQKLFHFDLELPHVDGTLNVGGRVFVRFDHGWEPLAIRWHRSLRRLFLTKFNV